MKFKINRNLLDQTLNQVSRGLSTKTPMPVLMGVYIKVEAEQITFITTNKEISVRVVLPYDDNIEIIEQGDCVVPGKYFVDIVKKIDDGMLEFTTFEENTIKIISNNSDFTLAAFNKNNFPQINFDIDANPIKFTCKEFKQIIRQTTFACGTNESRAILTSVNLIIKDGTLSAIATDSFRLSRFQKDIEQKDVNIQINVSAKSLEEFAKTIGDSAEEIYLYVSNNLALFKVANMSFVTRLVEGNYPDTQNLFKREQILKIEFDRMSLIQAVDRASLFTSTESLNLVKINVRSNSTNVEIASNSTEIGKVVVNLDSLNISDPQDFLAAFSAKNLLDALKASDEKNIVLAFTGEIKPAILYSNENQNLTQVLLPVRTF